jgi:hypothetical protein
MPIHYRSRLGTQVSAQAIEVEGRHAVFAISARECEAAIHTFRCVMSHTSIVGLRRAMALGNRCTPLGR